MRPQQKHTVCHPATVKEYIALNKSTRTICILKACVCCARVAKNLEHHFVCGFSSGAKNVPIKEIK